MKSPPWQNLTQSTQGTRDIFVSIISFNTASSCMQQMYQFWIHRTSALCFSPTLLVFWRCFMVYHVPNEQNPICITEVGRRINKAGDLDREIVQNLYHSAFLCNSVSWILSKLPMPSGWRGLSLGARERGQHTPEGCKSKWFHFLMFSYASSKQQPLPNFSLMNTGHSQNMNFSENQTPILFTNTGEDLICTNLLEIRSWLAMSILASGLPGKNGWLKLIWNRS